MRLFRWSPTAVLLLSALAAPSRGDLVVTRVVPESAAAKAGLVAGDRVEGSLRSFWELTDEEAPRGPVELVVRRQGPLRVRLADLSGVEVRPGVPAGRIAEVARAADAARCGAHREAARLYAAILRDGDRSRDGGGDAELRRYARAEAARALATGGFHVDAAALVLAAVPDAEGGERARLLLRAAISLNEGGELEAGGVAAREALSYYEGVDPGSVKTGVARRVLACSLRADSSTSAEQALSKELLDLACHGLERVAPGSYELASVWAAMGEHQGSVAFLEKARAIVEARAGEWEGHVRLLSSLGWYKLFTEGKGPAEEALLRALDLARRRGIESVDVADALTNLGVTINVGGDPAALRYLRRGVDLARRHAPGSRRLARALVNLGAAEARIQNGEPEAHYREAAAIFRRVAPASSALAVTLQNLAAHVGNMGDKDQSTSLLGEAIDVLSVMDPEGPRLAWALTSLGFITQGEPQSEGYLERAEAIFQRLGMSTAYVKEGLGRAALARGELGRAGDRFCEAGRMNEEARSSRFRSQSERDYSMSMGEVSGWEAYARLSAGELPAAFTALERSRAAGLLHMLAERRLVSDDEIPQGLREEAARLDAEVDRAQEALKKAALRRDEVASETLRFELATLRRSRERLTARIRDASPRLAGVRWPRPLSLEEALAALDPGTVALVYLVAEPGVALFVLKGGDASERSARVVRLRPSMGELTEEVRRLRRLVDRTAGGSTGDDALGSLARSLFDDLVAPALPELENARRILVSPDGPLHTLPFGLLSRSARAGPAWLGLWKPLHVVGSLTLFADLKSRRRPVALRGDSVALFGDPVYPTRGEGAALLRSAADRSLELGPLPNTRREVEAIARAVGSGARVYVGTEAREENVLALPAGVDTLHFACHGLVDEENPLNSSLVLTVPEDLAGGRENGLLQAWEVLDRLRLKADLVTLSACETALGRDSGTEGVLGLTRAFLLAGARTVVASLWRVPDDDATVTLMETFYSRLAAGDSRDEALRRAQAALAERGLAPNRWGGFEVVGDYRSLAGGR